MSVDARIEGPDRNADPLTIDVRDYWDISSFGPERDIFDEWMAGILGDGWKERHLVTSLTLGEGCADVEELVVRDGHIVRDANREPVTTTHRWPAPVPPPVWKPLR